MARAYKFRSIGKTLAAAALASAVALGLSACGTSGSPGTAFIVNGESFSESDLTDTVTQWAELSGVEVPRDQMAGFLVETTVRLQAADEVGVGLSEEDVQQTLEGTLAQANSDLSVSQIIPPVREMFRDLLLVNTVQSGAVSEEQITEMNTLISDASITLNPRYGTFTDGQIQAPGALPGTVTGNLLEEIPVG